MRLTFTISRQTKYDFFFAQTRVQLILNSKESAQNVAQGTGPSKFSRFFGDPIRSSLSCKGVKK